MFTLPNWACVSESLNQGQESVVVFGDTNPTVLNAPNLYVYGSPNDTAAEIGAANYFLSLYASLCVGDLIFGFGTDASFAYQVTAVSSTSVTVESMGLTTSIGTANIIDNAVTYVKIQQASATTLLGNPTNGTANVEEITLGNGLSFSGTTLQLDTNFSNYVEVSISAAQFNGMYAAPVELIAAPGANQMIVLDNMILEMTYGANAFASGGVVAAQYDSTVYGAGHDASNEEAAADFFAAASTVFLFQGVSGNTIGAVPLANAVNKGIYLSNDTGAFTTGDSTFTAKMWYKVIPTNS